MQSKRIYQAIIAAGVIIPLWLCVAQASGVDSTREGEKVISLHQLVPPKMSGWKAEGKDEIYNRDTIFDYMNGAGEIYRLYSFRELLVRRFTKSGESEITVELFDMGTSEDAFGVFTHGRESEEEGIGQGSEYRGGFLCFWKDKFFVCVFAEQDTPSTEKGVTNIAKAIDQAIKEKGSKPKLLDHLPQDGLVETTIRYFHTYISLNYHYYVADQNILNLNQQTEALLVRYQQEEGKCYLLLVWYPDEKAAKDAYVSFMEAYLPEAKQGNIIQTENEEWSGAEIKHEYVIVVLDAPTKVFARTLMEQVKDKLKAERP